MSLSIQDASIVKGMLARGDKQHDIAAHFGVNGGRIAEIASGIRFPDARPAQGRELPSRKLPRFIDPNSSPDRQYEQLMLFVKQPPETSRILVITPALAERVLANLNTNNRKKRPANIQRFSEAMSNRGWIVTGDTIKFARDGLLLDGQNRLSACVRAQMPFKTHAVFGIDEDAFKAIDAGAKRTAPDTFQVSGVPYAGIVSYAVRWLLIGDGNRGQTFDNAHLYDFYKKSVDAELMQDAARWASSVSKAVPHGPLAAHLYLFASKDTALAKKFATDLAEKTGAGKTVLRKLEALRQQNLGRLHEKQINAFLILAWNALREGKRVNVGMLRWTTDQEFPAIV